MLEGAEEMTEDFLSRAMREYEKVRPCDTMKVSLEARMERLEADASAQRAAILRLEKAAKLICKSLWALFAVLMILALKVLT
jgi:hypothetical protein